jgi:hypothetical protein
VASLTADPIPAYRVETTPTFDWEGARWWLSMRPRPTRERPSPQMSLVDR